MSRGDEPLVLPKPSRAKAGQRVRFVMRFWAVGFGIMAIGAWTMLALSIASQGPAGEIALMVLLALFCPLAAWITWRIGYR